MRGTPRPLFALAVGLALSLGRPQARAAEPPHTALWPFTLGLRVGAGLEPHGRGVPAAYGLGVEALWRGTVGAFASLLASSGSSIIPPMDAATGQGQPGLPDRLSIPFGVAARPFGALGARPRGWAARMAEGVGLQVGLSIEHFRVRDASSTTAGLHVEGAVEIPLAGGPVESGLTLRLGARLIVAPTVRFSATLPDGAVRTSQEVPIASGQILLALCYYP